MNGPLKLRHERTTGNTSAPPLAYAAVTTVVWVIYVALVILAPIALPSLNPLLVMGVVLVAAAVFHPPRRDVQRAAKRRFDHRRPGHQKHGR
jgi:hypothetical protein